MPEESANGEVSMVERVHVALRERILSGEYAPGSRLILGRLAQEHDVSFIPVREALRRLEGERLVVLEPNRGATVAPVSVADMRDVYETRVVLERHALRSAFPNLDEKRLKRADAELREMARGLSDGREREGLAHHRAFHFLLYEPGASPWTLHLIDQLWSSAERYLRLAPSLRPSPREFVAEHEAVLRAIRAGEVDDAVDLLDDNLRTTARLLAEQYGQGELDAS
jgi:DNA-binding GntR family transcriptional regulator